MSNKQRSKQNSSFFNRSNKVYLYYFAVLFAAFLTITGIFSYHKLTSDEIFESPLQKKYFVDEIKVKPGDTLYQILSPYQISKGEINSMMSKLKKKVDLKKLRANQIIQVQYSEDLNGEKVPVSLIISITDKNKIKIDIQDDSYPTTEINVEFRRNIIEVSTTINGNIVKSGLLAGAPTKNLMEIVNVYSNKIDLQKDVKKGDRLVMLLEKFVAQDGNSFFFGKTLYSSLTVNGTEKKLYLFKHPDGSENFFDDSGKSAKLSIMKKPVMAKRISSHFGIRIHPTFGYKRMHNGVDFAAPVGTPIYAAGDGKIVHIGIHGSYGRYLKIQHQPKLHTGYGHMKGFAKGLKKGSRVKQNQVIGYVGSTGRSTGPHLHYEVIINNQFVNPLKINFIPTKQLSGKNKELFNGYKRIIDSFLIQEKKQEQQLASSLANYKFS